MGCIDVNRRDVLGACREITQHIAAAGGYGDNTAVAIKRQSLQIDRWVFPDLSIDKVRKCQREKTLP